MPLLKKILTGTLIVVGILFLINLYLSLRSSDDEKLWQMSEKLDQKLPQNDSLYRILEEKRIGDSLTGQVIRFKKDLNRTMKYLDSLKEKVSLLSREHGSNSTKASEWILQKNRTNRVKNHLGILNKQAKKITGNSAYNRLSPEEVLSLKSKGITWNQHFKNLPHSALHALLSYVRLKIKEEEAFILNYILKNRMNRITSQNQNTNLFGVFI